jgi:hypothetical protein
VRDERHGDQGRGWLVKLNFARAPSWSAPDITVMFGKYYSQRFSENGATLAGIDDAPCGDALYRYYRYRVDHTALLRLTELSATVSFKREFL